MRNPGKLTAAQAGGIGGRSNADRHTSAYFARLGRKGGLAGGRPSLRSYDDIQGDPLGLRRTRAIASEFAREGLWAIETDAMRAGSHSGAPALASRTRGDN